MFNKSIAYRLSIYISLSVIIVFVSLIILLFFFNRNLLRENIENKAIGLSSVMNAEISKNILTTKEISLNIAEQIFYYSEHNDTEKLLSMVMKKYPFLNGIYLRIDSLVNEKKYFYIYREDKDIVYKESINQIHSCPTVNKVIETISSVHAQEWTEPYQNKGNNVVSFYCPVYFSPEEGKPKYAGQIISELSLYELNKSINLIEIEKHGYAFIINKNGDYITHPEKEWILTKNIYNLSAKVINPKKVNIESIILSNNRGSFIAYPEILGFKKSWVYHTPINQGRWVLFFVMPYNELFKELYFLAFGMFVFALLGIVAIYIIITYISNKLIEPLSYVTTQLNIFSSPGNKEKLKTMNEIRQVSDSLNYLKVWFDKYKNEQELEQIRSLRRHQDMSLASEIQRSFIKTDFSGASEIKNIDLYAIYKPAREISGDLFDYFFIDDENLVFTIGDVSGKGIPAALFMSIAQAVIKKNASSKKAKNIVNKANEDLCTSSHHQFFLTLFLGVFNIRKGELNYCNAAHTTALILRSTGKITELGKSHGLPLGLYPDKKYSDAKIKLEKGDSIVLYTDGVTGTENVKKEQFGLNHLKDKLAQLSPETSAKEMISLIERELNIFKGNAPQVDDICLFIIKYLP